MSGMYKCVTEVEGVRYVQAYTIDAYGTFKTNDLSNYVNNFDERLDYNDLYINRIIFKF